MILPVLILILVNVLMAAYHAYLFKRGKTVKHGWWALGYLVFAVGLAILTHSWLLGINSLFIRMVFFNLPLNLFRGLAFWYTPEHPKSIVDSFHQIVLQDKIRIYMPIYFIIIIVLVWLRY